MHEPTKKKTKKKQENIFNRIPLEINPLNYYAYKWQLRNYARLISLEIDITRCFYRKYRYYDFIST